jgi:hypothetical protein
MRRALTLLVAMSLSAAVAAQSPGTAGHATPKTPEAKPTQAQTVPAAPKAPAAATPAKPRAVTASEAAVRIAAALESMNRPGPAAAPRPGRAARPAAPRYQLRWPVAEARWRIIWSEQDRVTLTWTR